MNKNDIERFVKLAKGADLAALDSALEQLTGIAEEMRVKEREGLKENIEAMLARAGTNIAELYGKVKPPGVRAAKYRNPANPSQTWTGAGRMPGWMTEAKEKGINPDTFKIKDLPAAAEAETTE